MIKVEPIIVGRHGKEVANGVTVLPRHTGAVTLVRTEDVIILVDTGARGTLSETDEGLERLGLTRSDIDLIILTHFHLDHAFNVSAFPSSRVIGWSHEWCEGETRRIDDIEQWNEVRGVRLIKTPGHAEEHLSVLVETAEGVVCIAGDAINEHYYSTKETNVFVYDEMLYKKSATRILENAKRVVPGHGAAFEVA